MRLTVFAKHLVDEGIGTIGVDIFVDFMPANCEQGVLLRLPLQGVEIDSELPGYFNSRLQAIVRAPNFTAGETISAAVMSALTMEERTVLNDDADQPSILVNQMLPEHKPVSFPRSESGGIEWSMNFTISCVEK